MADAADSTPASGGQFALTIDDLNTTVNHEPRIEDLRLAEALGMDRPRDIRKLIERHHEALERLGAFCATVAQNTDSKGRGRPGRTFWLNKRQALYLCTKSETPRATETTIAMVEVFDAHLAARAAPPPAERARIAPVPFLAGPEPLVSSLHLAQALRRRHTGILRAADVLAAERPDLLGAHLRFSTYMHENGRPYRCFHLDRVAFAALMARLPSSDHLAEALRDATLGGWPEAPALPPPASSPTLDRDGLALMRVGDETVLVDMHAFEPERGARAVLLAWGGHIICEPAVCHYPHQNWYGRRVGHAIEKTHDDGRDFHKGGWILGTVVEARPAAGTGEFDGRDPAQDGGARDVKRGAPRGRVLPGPTLAALAVAGRA